MRTLRRFLQRRGASTEEARRAGGRSVGAIDSWWLDIKLGVRMLIKHPGLTLAGGVGIAVTVAIAAGGYSAMESAFLVSSVPLEEGNRIVSLEVWDSAANKPQRRILHDFHVWREELKSVREMSAFRTFTPNLFAPGVQPGSVRVAAMSASGFRVARVRPMLGRYLMEDDEREGAPAVVVISGSVWRNRFAADPAIVGRIIHLGATPYAIAGVMPENFAFPVNHSFWVPLRAGSAPPEPLAGPDVMAFGRLARGATMESAQAELATIHQRTATTLPSSYAQLRARVLPYTFPFAGLHDPKDAGDLYGMQGLAISLLVLVCLNVAILVYSRTAMRQGEIAVRTALGASRGRIVAQLFLEAFVLSAAAAMAGVAIAAFALRLIGGALLDRAADLPFWVTFDLSPGAVLCAGLLSVLAAAIVGIVPALKATRREVQTGLRVIGTGGSGMRLGATWTTLIVAQVGFAVAILPASVFIVWETMRSGTADPGFAAETFLSAKMGMDDVSSTDAREFTRRYGSRQAELMRRLHAEPQVSGATFSMADLGDEPGARIETDGGTPSASSPGVRLGALGHEVRFNYVDVHFFRTFEVPILAGRGLESGDIAAGLPPEGGGVVVNQSLAIRLFGGDALGRRVRYARKQDAEPGRWYEIVGIVSDFPSGASPGMEDSKLKLYHAVAAGQVQPVSIALRVPGGAPTAFAGRLREIAAAVDPDLQVRNVFSLDEVLRREQWIRLLEGSVFAAVTLSVLMLSAAGIYALMSLTVSQRRKEIGIRTALGADRRRIVASIFARAFGQLGAGTAVGLGAAALLDRTLWGNPVRDNTAAVLSVVALLMVAVGILGVFGPARRSLRIEPTEALREQ